MIVHYGVVNRMAAILHHRAESRQSATGPLAAKLRPFSPWPITAEENENGVLKIRLRHPSPAAWNAGKTVGTTQKQIWAIRFHLDREGRLRDKALFDHAIDSKPRSCDLVKIKIGDVVAGTDVRNRAIAIQQKTSRPVQFELTSNVRATLLSWLERRCGSITDYLFPSMVDHVAHEHAPVCAFDR